MNCQAQAAIPEKQNKTKNPSMKDQQSEQMSNKTVSLEQICSAPAQA